MMKKEIKEKKEDIIKILIFLVGGIFGTVVINYQHGYNFIDARLADYDITAFPFYLIIKHERSFFETYPSVFPFIICSIIFLSINIETNKKLLTKILFVLKVLAETSWISIISYFLTTNIGMKIQGMILGLDASLDPFGVENGKTYDIINSFYESITNEVLQIIIIILLIVLALLEALIVICFNLSCMMVFISNSICTSLFFAAYYGLIWIASSLSLYEDVNKILTKTKFGLTIDLIITLIVCEAVNLIITKLCESISDRLKQ